MNWLFEYAGRTRDAVLAGVLAAALYALAVTAFLLWIRAWWKRTAGGKRNWALSPVAAFALVAVLWLAVWLAAGPKIGRAWVRLQENVRRSYPEYVRLVRISAFLPPRGEAGRWAFARLATRDFGFAGANPVEVKRSEGHVIETFEDQDYGRVTTIDGRVAIAGTRFRETRAQSALVALFETPSAASALVVGEERLRYAPVLKAAGLEVNDAPSVPAGAKADIVFVAPPPDWIDGAGRVDGPLLDAAREAAGRDGAVALHLDARLLSVARAKYLIELFASRFASTRVWAAGRLDWVLVGHRTTALVMADEVLELLERPNAFTAFLEAGIRSAADIFASYVGTSEVALAPLAAIDPSDAASALREAPRLAFEPSAAGRLAPLRCDYLVTADPQPISWFVPGAIDSDVWQTLCERIETVRVARRRALAGFAAADAGKREEALDAWAEAAGANPRDPTIRALADSLDLEARRRLQIGDVNGALGAYESLVSIDSRNAAAIHNFGLCLRRAGQMELAAQVFARALAVDPKTDEHRIELAETSILAHHPETAVVEYEYLRKKHPDRPEFAARVAKALASRENPHRNPDIAVRLAEQAVEDTKGEDRFCLEALAEVYMNCEFVLKGMSIRKRLREMR